jgi:hypothetical protein
VLLLVLAMKTPRAAALLALAFALLPAAAQESRPFNPIGRPGTAPPPGAPTAGAPAPPPAPVAPPAPAALRDAVQKSVDQLAASWNTPALKALLSPTYYDRDRVQDALVSKVPRDATLRVLAVQSVQVLSQQVRPTSGGMEEEVVTKVSVTLRTQVEFNDPVAGFQRREGLNEAIFTLREVR